MKMKKIFSILAAAVIALSFASCEKSDLGGKYFKIKIVDKTESTVVFKVTPADTSVYYAIGGIRASQVEQYSADSIANMLCRMYNNYYTNGYSLETLREAGLVYKGVCQDTLPNVPQNTDLAIIAFQLVEEGERLVVGGFDVKYFNTKIEVKGTKKLGTIDNATFFDNRNDDGSFFVSGYTSDNSGFLNLWIFDDDFKGTYTYAELDAEYCYVWTKDMGEGDLAVSFVADAKITGTYNAETQLGKLEGWVLCYNGIKYTFTANYSSAEELVDPAPKKVIGKAIPKACWRLIGD